MNHAPLRNVCALVAAAATCNAVHANSNGVTYRTVVTSDESVAFYGGPISYGNLEFASINNDGVVSFNSNMTPLLIPSGLVKETDSGLELIGIPGAMLPGLAPGVFVERYFGPTETDEGTTATIVRLEDADGFVANALYTWKDGVATPVVIPGMQAPGEASGVNFLSFRSFRMNKNGEILFRSYVEGPGIVEGDNWEGIWTTVGGSTTKIIRQGEQVPGQPATVVVGELTNNAAALNDNGDFIMELMYETPFGDIWSMWTGSGSTLGTEIAQQGQGSPISALVTWLGGISLGNDVSITNDGEVAFSQAVDGAMDPLSAIWRSDAGVLSNVAIEDVDGPTPDTSYSTITGTSMSRAANGEVFFSASVTGPGVTNDNNTMILSHDGMDITIISREGDQVPGMAPGILFGSTLFYQVACNALGQYSYETPITGPGVTDDNDAIHVVEDRDGNMVVMVREGDVLEVAPGDFRTVTGFSNRTGNGSESGSRGNFNDRNELLLNVFFSDGTEAFMVFRIPFNCRGDANGDNLVNFEDLNLVLGNWGATGDPGFIEGDINCDGSVDFEDLNLVLGAWGVDCN